MKTTVNYFSRMLCVFLLSAGVALTSCEETDPIDDNKTEQGGNENNGNENEGGQETPEEEDPATLSLGEVTFYSATFTGHLNVPASEVSFTQVSILYSDAENFNVGAATSVAVSSFDSEQNFTVTLTDLKCLTKYNYCLYVKEKSAEETYGEIQSFTTLQHPYLTEEALDVSAATDLSSTESANCYIVSETGLYKFKAVKGNSNESVGNVATADVLWETFGSDVTPMCGDLISGVCHKDGYIAFEVNKTFKEGNAVIHAKDAEGNIIWSWHIWMTDKPQEQVYFNDAGTMMDRNLGATSATPGDVRALGLLYQWGRKDPFLGSSNINEAVEAKSTIEWPSAVISEANTGTIAYAIANPATFITGPEKYSSEDWYYTGERITDNTRWTTSEKEKSIYDPCPVGWRVPDGDFNGVWRKAAGINYFDDCSYDNINKGKNLAGKFGSDQTIWYPSAGFRNDYRLDKGKLFMVFGIGSYWSASHADDGVLAYVMSFRNDSRTHTMSLDYDLGCRAQGSSVRCIKE